MQKFQGTFEIHKRPFISVFSIWITVPLKVIKEKLKSGFIK